MSGTESSIIVLGGGMLGVTTAIALAERGWPVHLVTDHVIGDPLPAPLPAEFASLFPAASVVPHSLGERHLVPLLRAAHRVFRVLAANPAIPVDVLRHHELFEMPVDAPVYLECMGRVESVSTSTTPLRRPGADAVHGWSYDCYFVDTPRYIRYLRDRLRTLGITVTRRHLTPEDLPRLDAPVIVNATGLGAARLVDDPATHTQLRGTLLHVRAGTRWRSRQSGRVESYGYTPVRDVYPDNRAGAGDLYFYPRSTTAVIGGTRERGRLDEHGRWHGDPIPAPTLRRAGFDFPRPLLDLNRTLVRQLTGHDLLDYPIEIVQGVRYARDLDGGGPRIEHESRAGRSWLHIYGFGGGGVSLSWGAATWALAQTRRLIDPPPPPSSTRVAEALRSAETDVADLTA